MTTSDTTGPAAKMWVSAYLSGIPMTEIAQNAGISAYRLRRVLDEAGVPKKRSKRKPMRLKITKLPRQFAELPTELFCSDCDAHHDFSGATHMPGLDCTCGCRCLNPADQDFKNESGVKLL